MESIYTTSVKNVPEDYNDPTPAYKKHVWIAVAGIVSFFLLYLYLTYWFFYSAYRLLYPAFTGGNGGLMNIGIGLMSLFLGVFMIKAFFFVQTKYDVQDKEIKPEDEPLLFDYLHKLADEVGAPRPSKVYLSNRVNACVFYDLSLLNLFFPSKKNLEIGLGLINVLNLGEVKAVLAHEFGHFAQKSMLVGRWVYIANQIANSVIAKRDVLDSFLSGLSRIDIRIAWIGWILSIIVWSIRSLVELIFRLVILTQRALSREMEFQADLVAVSATGSDAIVHALHKLQAADAAFSSAMGTVNEQIGNKKAVEDIYAVQTASIAKTAYILNDKNYGTSPEVPTENPENHRVFSDKIAQPPKMWSTHPPDQEREANAKRHYIPGFIDDRSAWVLFKNPTQTRLDLTADLIKTANVETEVITTEELMPLHNKQFEKSYFNPAYKGVYLNRFFCQEFQDSGEIYRTDINPEQAATLVQDLYPESLVEDLEDFSTLKEEKVMLEAIKENRMTASGSNGIWHRGTQIRRQQLPKVIDSLAKEVEAARLKVADHDRLCRTVHLRLAEKIGMRWDEYLEGLLHIIHYAEHNILNISDANQILAKVLNIVMADNNVSSKEMVKLLQACNELYRVLENVYQDSTKIKLDNNLLTELDTLSWSHFLEDLKLGRANQENINQWIQVVGSWVAVYIESLSRLRSEALEVLLQSEDKVQKMYQSNTTEAAPAPTYVDVQYEVMMPGDERKTNMKLNLWDKFIAADGMVASLTKFAVAASIVGGTVYMAGTTGQQQLSIYNGLSAPMTVNLNGDKLNVGPHSSRTVSLDYSKGYEITTQAANGEVVETFQPSVRSTASHYVYNIARAAAMYKYTVYYGGIPRNNDQMLGNGRWMQANADYILQEPPKSISTSGSSTTRNAITALSNINPTSIISVVQGEENQSTLIRSHALWDSNNDKNTLQWLGAATALPDFKEVFQKRMEKYPNEIATARMLMDAGDDTSKAAVCADFEAKFAQEPNNPDLYYIKTRCLPDGPEQNQEFINGANKWPEHGWLNYAASYAYTRQGDWRKAHESLMMAYPKVAGLKEQIALLVERIARYRKTKGESLEKITDSKNEYLSYYKSLEEGLEKAPADYAYFLINEGRLEEALAQVEKEVAIRPNVLAMCAMSDDAKEEWIKQALEIDPNTLNNSRAVLLAGLYLRKKKGLDKFEQILTDFTAGEDISALDFIAQLKSKNYDEAERVLLQSSVQTQGYLSALAYVAQGDKVPSDWKTKAQTMLFAGEKPYIK